MLYTVHWSKTYHMSGILSIEANSKEEAEDLAYTQLGDYEGKLQYDPAYDEVCAYENTI